MKPLEQHQLEIQRNKHARAAKPLIRKIYADFYDQIVASVAREVAGPVVEIGAGSGELKSRIPNAICTDLFPNPWLDLVCDAYSLPFAAGAVSNLLLLDVFHHLARPFAFLTEAVRVLGTGGRLVIFDPYISLISSLAFGVFHHEPIAWWSDIDLQPIPPATQTYYAAQGNATRLFFRQRSSLPPALRLISAEALSNFAYLLSGGLSKRALYPEALYPSLKRVDNALSALPRLFGARCLVVLQRN